MKPLIVGESNPYGDDPQFAMYPLPEGAAGWRLCHAILGMRKQQYLESFERVNLCTGDWWPDVAKIMANEIKTKSDRAILLGSKVTKAFGFEYLPLTVKQAYTGARCLLLPHPSGRCRTWNDPEMVVQARNAVGDFLPDLRHLLGVDQR